MIQLTKQPYWWTPAHAPAVFEFDYESKAGTTFGHEGKLVFTPSFPFGEQPLLGQLLYIQSGTFKGYHVITGYDVSLGGMIQTATEFTGASYIANAKLITKHEFTLYKGYPDGVLFYETQPLTKVARFISEPNSDGVLSVNISGYLKSIFDATDYKDLTSIVSLGGAQWATGLFTRYYLFSRQLDNQNRLIEANWLVNFRMVLHAHTDPVELTQYYWRTGANLSKEIPSLIFNSCDTILMSLEDAGVLLRKYTNGVPAIQPSKFTDSFTDSFNK